MRLIYLILILPLLTGIVSCSSLEEKDDSEMSAHLLYQKGKKALGAGDYEGAIEHFESLETRFPFGIYAQQALLDIAYANYKFDDRESSISAANRFIKNYPRHEHVDYAFYIRGVARFKTGKDFFDRTFDLDPSRREPLAAREAFYFFKELIDRYPDSIYVNDSRQRMVYLRNHLAQHEIHVANYYIDRGAYVAASNRANTVLEVYTNSPSTPDALLVLVQAYRNLELDQLANDATKVLELNFPGYLTRHNTGKL